MGIPRRLVRQVSVRVDLGVEVDQLAVADVLDRMIGEPGDVYRLARTDRVIATLQRDAGPAFQKVVELDAFLVLVNRKLDALGALRSSRDAAARRNRRP